MGAHTRRKSWRDRLTGLLAAVLVIAGVSIAAYPSVADWLADGQHATVINSYQGKVDSLDQAERDKQMAEARKYNESLAGDPVHDPFIPGSGYALPENYTSVLNPDGDGVMGYLTIKKIDVYLPIYHGTSEDILDKGVGHMRQTALPIGGEDRRPVLTGHRGLPNAELFTRLDELDKGDVFTINVLGKTLAYKVVEIKTVLPSELEELRAVKGRDLVTLLTCTPYGVNTHRLLVTGERTTLAEANKPQEQTISIVPRGRWLRRAIIAGVVVVAATAVTLVYVKRKPRR
ncbi:sortase [Bifidobacterium cebidarum]|uniref:Sortase n=2 Tax=Bifidobacterium cebidarum TaxID=2650773 RepID=A0A6I1GA97_9BIFI|nr:sortase [Bifidobacterium cebidarum]